MTRPREDSTPSRSSRRCRKASPATAGPRRSVSADGRFVYASNRGFNSVVLFAIDATNGCLRPVGYRGSEGNTPRFFAIDPSGRFTFVANEDSDTIVTFAVDGETGKLTATGDVIRTGSPACILFR